MAQHQQLRRSHHLGLKRQKLQKGEEEDIAGTYFKPKRANELLVRFQDDANTLAKPLSKKNSSSNNALNVSMSQSMWGNALNLNSSFNNSSNSYNSSWGSNSSSSSVGGTGVGGVMSNGWLGGGFSSISPEMSLRRPTRLEALPTMDSRRTRKKSKDVLHTLDLI